MKRLACIIILSIGFLFSAARPNNVTFTHIGLNDGLSDTQVTNIMQDSKGFMWFSTRNGLNRYDGHDVKTFMRQASNPNSLPDNLVNVVYEDADGLFWIQIAWRQYVCYDPMSETFLPSDQVLADRYGITATPNYILVDDNKCLWLADTKSIYCIDPTHNDSFEIPISRKHHDDGSTVVYIAPAYGGLIVIYSDGSFDRIDKGKDYRVETNYDLTRLLAGSNKPTRVYCDNDGDLWFYGYDSGIMFYDNSDSRWIKLDNSDQSKYRLSSLMVSDIIQDSKGDIWIATDNGGINVVNKDSGTVTYVNHIPHNSSSLLQNSVTCLYCDNSGGIWVGYHKHGLSYHNEERQNFMFDDLSELETGPDFIPDINAFASDRNGMLWIGTSNGLISKDEQTGAVRRYTFGKDGNSAYGNVITCLLSASDGLLYIGTYQNGLKVYDGKKFTDYHHDAATVSLADNNVWSLEEDDDGLIWIGTLGNGFQCFNPKTGKFSKAMLGPGNSNVEYVSRIQKGQDGKLYMATESGVIVYSPKRGTLERLDGNRRGDSKFSNHSILDLCVDSRGLVWIATPDGLNVYDPKTDEVVFVTSDMTLGIVEDDNKSIWATNIKGLSNVDVTIDPKTGGINYILRRYDTAFGNENLQFNQRSLHKSRLGYILAGGMQGYVGFLPADISNKPQKLKPVFTALHELDREVKVDSIYDGNKILSKSIVYSDEINLGSGQNMFTVYFSAMDYAASEDTKYEYMLEGFNNQWLSTHENKITYTNLAPGRYLLKVRVLNATDDASVAELAIVIEPPFWRSNWAYLIYGISLLAAIGLAWWLIRYREKQKFAMMQLEKEAQREHEVDEMRLRFFTNISHELRTPLSLMIAPLENVIKSVDEPNIKNKIEMALRNAMRLLDMVNQLLDLRKSEVKGHQLNLMQGDIVDHIHSVCNSFGEYYEKKNIKLVFFSAVKELWTVFDADKITKIVMNLLSNAFKFTPDGGKVDVSLDVIDTDDGRQEFEIKVTDTGIGISDDDKKHIFERFYQAKNPSKTGGSGIGLHLTKEFVDLHGGKIEVCDNLGKGTAFIITLPISTHEMDAKTTGDIKADTDKPVVLIVDDNEDFRTFMADMLQSDYVVKVARDGVEAWEIIPELLPDIIVTDVMMPRMDGNELCRTVKGDIRTSHIPVILLTAQSAREHKLKALTEGADEYITKPFDFDILAVRIKKLLALKKVRQSAFNKPVEIAPSEITITSLDEKLIKKAIKYVEDNIDRSDLSVEELSRELAMSRVHLYKKMTSITGKTPIEFIRVIRLKRAAQYLRESQLTISEVAYMTGFNNIKFFRKYFKDEFGMLPSEYMRDNNPSATDYGDD